MFNLRRNRSARRTWTYRCYIDCADEIMRWARRHPEFKARRSRGPLVNGMRPHIVSLTGPADLVLPDPGLGTVAGWGVGAPWHDGLPVGYAGIVPEHVRNQLLAENRAARARWGDA